MPTYPSAYGNSRTAITNQSYLQGQESSLTHQADFGWPDFGWPDLGWPGLKLNQVTWYIPLYHSALSFRSITSLLILATSTA